MRPLTSLNPEWIGQLRPKSGEGILFDCPGCGKHHIAAYFSNPLDGEPGPTWQNPTWLREGASFATLTIKPSIDYPCFHGWVENGRVFSVNESPLTVLALIDGKPTPVALSPLQVVDIGGTAIAQAKALLDRKEKFTPSSFMRTNGVWNCQAAPMQTAHDTEVPLAVAAEGWKEYAAQGHGCQSLARINERGGFGASELAILLYDRIKRLESERTGKT
jgi:hypothetical protein